MTSEWFADRKNLMWAALCCIIPLLGWWAYGLFDLDEGFYAAIARDMMRRGEWITPTLGGDPWFEKPILIYWLAIPFTKIFGEDVGPRLPSVLATLGLTWGIVRWLKPKLGLDAAVTAGLIYGTSFLAVVLGRMFMTDALLALTLSGCLMLFFDSCHGRPSLRLASGALLGLAILAKGPVAGVFFIIIASLSYWLIPSMRPGYRKMWLPAIGACLVIMATWYVPCYLANGQVFVDEFLIKQNLMRFAGGDVAHNLKPWMWWLHPIYYPLVLILGLLPWTFSIKPKNISSWPEEEPRIALKKFLWIWLSVVVVFFSISLSKLPHYILPALAPLAMLGAEGAFRRGLTGRKALAIAEGWAPLCLLIMMAGFMSYDRQQNQDLHGVVKQLRKDHGSEALLVVGLQSREKRKAEGGLGTNETSRPSIGFYWPSFSTKDWRVDTGIELVKEKLQNERPYMVLLTRQGEDVAEMSRQALKHRMVLQPIRVESEKYRAFEIKYVGQ